MDCPQCSTANPDFAESCSNCGTPMPISDAATIQLLDTSALTPGSDFGPRYRIESLLGQGGMGRVYKAYDKTLDRIVAIKVVRQGMVGEAGALQRFKQELLLASKISHKNVLRIHDMGEVGPVKFISMAYVEGPDLYHVLRDNPKLPFERVTSFARQLAEALAAAHGEGVVHRDLKPQNILVAKDDHIYVSDFGLAKSFEDDAVGMTRSGAFLGTPRYMSPEQVEGNPADQRSDLYAYGLILYEMVTGDVPFTGETTLKVMYQRLQQTPKSPKLVDPSLPAWFDGIVMRCLEKDPAVRYQNANEIVVDLQGAQSSVSTSRAGATRLEGRTVQIQVPRIVELRWTWAVAGLLALAGLALAISPVRRVLLGRHLTGNISAGPASIPSLAEGRFVAILPFRVLGDEQQLGYVAEGLNEALSAKLFQLKDLRLASNTAVAKVSDKDPMEKTARELGSNLLVTGMVQGSAQNMRIIVNLDDVTSGKRTWSQEFSGVSKDLLSIEDQISAQLVTALAVNPTNEEMAHAAERPTNNSEAYDLYLKGNQALKGPDTTKAAQSAIDFFEQSTKQDPSFALAYTGLADASLLMYRTNKDSFWSDKAVVAAQRAEQLKDNLPEVHFALGTVYMRTGKTIQAIAELKRGLQLAPRSDEGYLRLGSAYLDSGQVDDAIGAYKKAIDVNPYYWGSHIDLGDAYLNSGDNAKALAEFKRVTELEPDNESGWSNVGIAYDRLGEYEQAIPNFEKSISLKPTWNGYSNLSSIYFLLHRYPEAVQTAEQAVALGPNQADAVGNLADAYRWSGQKDKASTTYDKAISLGFKELQVNPQNTYAMAGLALYYAKKGQPDRGMEFIRRARGIDTGDVELLYIQGVVENLSNKPDEALRDLQLALSKGYPAKEADSDPELGNLRNRPEFAAMVRKFNQATR
jgi:eukaryotic-like serine/threonine-protein kinase